MRSDTTEGGKREGKEGGGRNPLPPLHPPPPSPALRRHPLPLSLLLGPLLLFLLLLFSLPEGCQAIDCFKCVSVNGDNPGCEDPFHNNFSTTMLESPCMAGRKGREGLFPATACIKLAGVYDDTGEHMVIRECTVDSGSLTLDTELGRMSHCGAFVFAESPPAPPLLLLPLGLSVSMSRVTDQSGERIVIRSCALDSGTLTTDTEIIRMSHCGGIVFNDKYVKGCLQSCDDYEGCNSALPSGPSLSSKPTLAAALLFLLLLHRWS